jgi:hypothetical protein
VLTTAFAGRRVGRVRGTAVGGDGDGGQKTEEVYRRYAIVDEAMIREAAIKMNCWIFAALQAKIHQR